MEAPIGPPATLTREPGQAWKGAAAASDVCAGMWLVGVSTHLAFVVFTISRHIFSRSRHKLQHQLTWRDL